VGFASHQNYFAILAAAVVVVDAAAAAAAAAASEDTLSRTIVAVEAVVQLQPSYPDDYSNRKILLEEARTAVAAEILKVVHNTMSTKEQKHPFVAGRKLVEVARTFAAESFLA
jgi:hypothetical protein